jgi:hypothetical protein
MVNLINILMVINIKSFILDHCLGPTNNNTDVYNNVVQRVAMSSLEGINGNI